MRCNACCTTCSKELSLRRAVRSLAVTRFPLRADARERFALLSSPFSLRLVSAPPSCAVVLVSSVELSICTRHDAPSRLLCSPEQGGGCVVVDTGEVTVVVVEAGPVDVVVLAPVVDVARSEVVVATVVVVDVVGGTVDVVVLELVVVVTTIVVLVVAGTVVVVVTGAVDVVVLVAGTVVVVVVSHAASQQGRLGIATCFACGVTDAPRRMWMMDGLSR